MINVNTVSHIPHILCDTYFPIYQRLPVPWDISHRMAAIPPLPPTKATHAPQGTTLCYGTTGAGFTL